MVSPARSGVGRAQGICAPRGRGNRGELNMRSSLRASVVFAAIATGLVVAPAAVGQDRDPLQMYTLHGRGDGIAKAAGGVELAGQRQTASGIEAQAVLTR